MHKSLDEFEFCPDPTTEGSKVSLPDGTQVGFCAFVHPGVHSTLSIMNLCSLKVKDPRRKFNIRDQILHIKMLMY